MLNVKYLLALVFIVSFDRAYKEVYTKKILKIFYGPSGEVTTITVDNIIVDWTFDVIGRLYRCTI